MRNWHAKPAVNPAGLPAMRRQGQLVPESKLLWEARGIHGGQRCHIIMQLLVPTCGTHLGDTKEVASTTGMPAPASRSISSTLTSVGTWG